MGWRRRRVANFTPRRPTQRTEDPQQRLIAPVPLTQDAVNAYVSLGTLSDEPVEVLGDAQVDALIGAPQARP